MKKQFKFKLGGIYLDKDNTIFTATLNDDNIYKISWTKANGEIGRNGYIKDDVEDFIKVGKWIIIKENNNKLFTVKYYNKALEENKEKSFTSKKDALVFIRNCECLCEIADIRLFKTKEIDIYKLKYHEIRVVQQFTMFGIKYNVGDILYLNKHTDTLFDIYGTVHDFIGTELFKTTKSFFKEHLQLTTDN